jgi:hypothetical protein
MNKRSSSVPVGQLEAHGPDARITCQVTNLGVKRDQVSLLITLPIPRVDGGSIGVQPSPIFSYLRGLDDVSRLLGSSRLLYPQHFLINPRQMPLPHAGCYGKKQPAGAFLAASFARSCSKFCPATLLLPLSLHPPSCNASPAPLPVRIYDNRLNRNLISTFTL